MAAGFWFSEKLIAVAGGFCAGVINILGFFWHERS